ncbi:asparaginyl-tRNA synthetase [Parathielavia hyrcaniae]|uniref:asparagine--tRNA ligase n=1 Tax=Parathielavia hyrcaniae TaxID=113614 RepID=A0AAN6PYL1_9PEZI|nr:asparaginyl-tRNA synthetase [Parathielavia hyrcaniae]
MRPAPALRPSSVSRVLVRRRVPGSRRHVSQRAPRSVAELLQWRPAENADDVVVHGFVRSVRSMKTHRFVSLGDGSSLAPLQALVQASHAETEGLTVGAAVRLTGSWVASPGAGQSHELHVGKVEVLGPSDAKTFPIQKKYQTPEYLRTMPHLRPRTPVNAVLLRLRSEAIASLTQFLAGRSFTQTHPPIITSSDCEGAGEVFTVTPVNHTPDHDEPFFRSQKYLTVSTQLHLEALAQAVGNVWTLSPVFRAERSDTSRHLSEFYMLEAEMSFVDRLDPIMDLAEDMLRSLSTSLAGSATVQDLLSRSRNSGSDLAPADEVRRRWEGLAARDWPRITYSDAVALLRQRADRFAHEPTWGAGLQSEHERYLAEHVGGGGGKPVFVTHYPRDIKAFYMRETEPAASPGVPGGATVDCFDLLVPEFCEIAGGSMREHRLGPLLDVMRRQGILRPPGFEGEGDAGPDRPSAGGLEWYVDLRRWGCPPHGGFGLGFDRLLSYLAGVQTVRDMVSFPRWHGRCDC